MGGHKTGIRWPTARYDTSKGKQSGPIEVGRDRIEKMKRLERPKDGSCGGARFVVDGGFLLRRNGEILGVCGWTR